ncbi:MAG TPA: hypothetical protein VFZ12_09070 [Dehalococcoidia bacterium]|nr:hypothetical protein [Dehalococcoidia bacterium]
MAFLLARSTMSLAVSSSAQWCFSPSAHATARQNKQSSPHRIAARQHSVLPDGPPVRRQRTRERVAIVARMVGLVVVMFGWSVFGYGWPVGETCAREGFLGRAQLNPVRLCVFWPSSWGLIIYDFDSSGVRYSLTAAHPTSRY